MKALIVDDEKHVRSAIKLLVHWEEVNITEILEADNVNDAETIVKEHKPEIIFTDIKMPERNGMDFMKWLKESSCLSKIIVISGYDDFSYVRYSMQYGSMDYILKPIDEDQLNDSVKKAVNAYNSEEQQRTKSKYTDIKLNAMTPLYWDNIFSNIIKSPFTYYDKEEEIKNNFMLDGALRECQIAVLNFDTVNISDIKGFEREPDLFFFLIKNICNEILGNLNYGFAFKNLNSAKEVDIIFWKGLQSLEDILISINNELYKVLKLHFDFGLSSVKLLPDDISSAHFQALKALKLRNVLRVPGKAYLNSHWIHTFSNEHLSSKININFSNYEDRIKIAIQSCNKEQVQGAIKLWINWMKSQNTLTVDDIQLELNQCSILLSKLVTEFFENKEVNFQIFSAEELLPKIIDEDSFLLISDLENEILKYLYCLCDLLYESHRKENKVIYEIARYLESNYKENISLKDISQIFYLSREYISRKFKQELGENISDYLSRIRIEKAKILLKNPSMKIREISQLVGYEDDKYFHKVFKKLEGISPNEYRNSNNSQGENEPQR